MQNMRRKSCLKLNNGNHNENSKCNKKSDFMMLFIGIIRFALFVEWFFDQWK